MYLFLPCKTLLEKIKNQAAKLIRETDWALKGAEILPRVGMLLLFISAWVAAGTGEIQENLPQTGIGMAFIGILIRFYCAITKDRWEYGISWRVFFDAVLGSIAVFAGLFYFQFSHDMLSTEDISTLGFIFSVIAIFFLMVERTFFDLDQIPTKGEEK